MKTQSKFEATNQQSNHKLTTEKGFISTRRVGDTVTIHAENERGTTVLTLTPLELKMVADAMKWIATRR